MGQKVSPIGFRTGITIGWKSRWYAPKSNYGEFLVEDAKIREYIHDRLNRQPPYAAISTIEIERTREEVKVILKTARPGLVIGPKGAEVDKLRSALEDLTDRRVNINIVEINNPDLDAKLLAEGISEQLKRRSSFRRVMRQRAEGAMQAGAKGVKVMVSGRLGGAEMSRSETTILGSIPLHTLEANVDYGLCQCVTTYGTIGVKVWVYRGMFGDAEPEGEQAASGARTRARRRRETGPGQPGGPGGPGGRRTPQAGARPKRAKRAKAAEPTAAGAKVPVSEPEASADPPAPAETEPKPAQDAEQADKQE